MKFMILIPPQISEKSLKKVKISTSFKIKVTFYPSSLTELLILLTKQ